MGANLPQHRAEAIFHDCNVPALWTQFIQPNLNGPVPPEEERGHITEKQETKKRAGLPGWANGMN